MTNKKGDGVLGLLLHRYALGEVSWLVYVAASSYGYVVGEELEGDYFEDGGRSSWEAGVWMTYLL